MAVVEEGLFGRMSGRLGRGVFAYNRMGKIILRRSPGKRKKSSDKQEKSMNVFSLMNGLYPYVKRTLGIPVWKLAGAKHGKMANNYFTSVNRGILNDDGMMRDYGQFVLTEGELLNPDGMAVEAMGNGQFCVTWVAEGGCRTRRGTDRLMVLVLWEEKDGKPLTFGFKWAKDVTGKRNEGSGTFSLPFAREKEFLHAYCFFGAADDSAYSRSVHFVL